jgi:hypothetical protein
LVNEHSYTVGLGRNQFFSDFQLRRAFNRPGRLLLRFM